ncbi:hypothetical protein Zm00014a_040108 [Zea mays]|uniref:Uncharacterized protein n=2 Tax=Zea mays TaxID=4577 RepID=A0A3L6EJX6_MAIZE|nr:hypothetical protein Zm00014a_040108 [Zea mays]PWZ21287.1 hypothetical protein Zm00014a_040108 [Zea mays]PWZ21288.1 hypothetical protein Zm00014a_040108 [Zea mays]
MAELRHATAATRATSSPSKRDAEAASASSPLVASPRVDGGKDGLRPQPRWSLPPPLPLPPRARGPQVPHGFRLLPDSRRRNRLLRAHCALLRAFRLDTPHSLLTLVLLLDPRTRRTCAARRGFGSTAPG